MSLLLRIQRHYPEMPLPAKAHPGDAAFDLTAMAVTPLRPRVFSFDSGISVEVEPGYFCEVVPRSSIVKTDFMMANGIGVIDPDYRGRIGIVLRFFGEGGGEPEAAELVGRRIAQLLVRRVEPVTVEAAGDLAATARGSGGFGSTGH